MKPERLTQEEKLKIAERGYADPVFFCKFFLSHLFPKDIPWVHRGILAILTKKTDFLWRYGDVRTIMEHFAFERAGTKHFIFGAVDKHGNSVPLEKIPNGACSSPGCKLVMNLGRYTLIMLPRGFSKTTIAGIAVPLYEVLYQDNPFVVYVSETAPHAKMQVNNVKREIESNETVKAVFGGLKPDMKDAEKWTEDFFETLSGMAMAARGRGGQVRGLNHRGQRPRKIICDDLEDKESVSTDLQRQKTREWAYGDLLPALPEMDAGATLVALATKLHADALTTTWENDPDFTVVKFGCALPDGSLLWPEMMTKEKIIAKKESYALAGLLHVFYLEYFNESRSAETQKFRREFFIYEVPKDVALLKAIYLDPAISENKRADEATIYVAGMAEDGRIFVLDGWARRGASPREIIDRYFELAKLWRPLKHGVEGNAFQAALVHLMREEMFRHAYYFEPIKVTHSTKKKERVEGILQPRYAAGYMRHTRVFLKLETQLLDWEVTEHDDHPDALAGAVALLDPFAAHAATVDLGKSEYEELGDEHLWAP